MMMFETWKRVLKTEKRCVFKDNMYNYISIWILRYSNKKCVIISKKKLQYLQQFR